MSRRGLCILVLAAALVGAGVACAAPPTAEPPAAPVTTSTASAGGTAALDDFGTITVIVVDAQGQTHTVCLWLADTPALQERGLMYVTDPDLGGRSGMVFAYDHDEDGAFWMRNTRLPLSIAWFGADGTTVSSTDMAPCPDSEPDCPTYPAAGPYRFAIEVPQGGLGDLGISADSRVTLGNRGCTRT